MSPLIEKKNTFYTVSCKNPCSKKNQYVSDAILHQAKTENTYYVLYAMLLFLMKI